MTDAEFLARWQAGHDSKDAGAWLLCELALDARESNFPDWNIRLAVLERRSPRVIRDWLRAAEIRQAVGAVDGLSYSFYVAAGRRIDKIEPRLIYDLLREFAAEQGATLEEFCAELRALAGDDDGTDYGRQWERLAVKLFGLVDSLPPAVGKHVNLAAQELGRAAKILESENGAKR